MKTIHSAVVIVSIWAVTTWAEGPDWSATLGTTLDAGELATQRSGNASVSPTFSIGEDWEVEPTLAWSTSQSSAVDTLAHSLVPSVSVRWSVLDELTLTAGGWVSALEDPLDEGGSLDISSEFEPLDWLTLGGGLSGGWSQSSQWFGSLYASTNATFGKVRPGLSADLTYATVPVSTGGKSSKAMYTFQTSAGASVDFLLGPVTLGPSVAWTGYSYDKKAGGKSTQSTGNSKASVSGSHSEWNAGAHLSWKAMDWLVANAWGGRRWTTDETSTDATTKRNKQGKVVSTATESLTEPTVDYAGVSVDFSW
ncbi:MAG: hypothetical protein IPO40_19290 [Fibrobacteres bacterium]|nr:hypothetical protein [Fibrobacterota bacterium]